MQNIVVNCTDDASHCNILKIGANNGQCPNDNIYGKVEARFRVIFVEPVPRLFNELQKYYNGIFKKHRFTFLNKAVGGDRGKIKIYYPSITNDFSKLPWWIDQLAGTDPQHFANHGYDIDLDMSYIPMTTISQICSENNIKTIDYLSVDTEGSDYHILMSMKMNIKPRYITFEHLHMDGFKKTDKKYEELISKFGINGYTIMSKDNDNTTLFLK